MTELNTSNHNSSARHPGLILALISLPVFIGALDLTIVSAVLPNVILDLQIPIQTGLDDAAWVVSGYLLAYTVSVALMGRISDLVGRRRTYFIALLIFILGSWWVAVATAAPAEWLRRSILTIDRLTPLDFDRPDPSYMALYALIAGRVIQAFGAGAMVPVSMALVGDLYVPGRRATPLGIVGAVDTAGWVLGHLYGGLMVQIVEWPVLFWINIPITTLVAALTWRLLRRIAESHGEGGLSIPSVITILLGAGLINVLAVVALSREVFTALSTAGWIDTLFGHSQLALGIVLVMLLAVALVIRDSHRPPEASRPDWIGAVLITIVLAGFNLGLGGESGELPPSALYLLGASALALIAFVVAERLSPHPLFNLAYFRKRNISLASFINLLVGFCLMIGLVSVPLFVNSVIAETADEAALMSGIALAGLTVPMALASIPGGLITSWFGYRVPTVLGLAVAAAGFFLATSWTPNMELVTLNLPQLSLSVRVPPIMLGHMALAGIGLGLTVAPIGAGVIDGVRAAERGIASALVLIMRLLGMTLGTSIMTAYGLRRTDALLDQAAATAGGQIPIDQIVQVGMAAVTQTISEMLLAAAIICLIALLPAVLIRPREAEPGELPS